MLKTTLAGLRARTTRLVLSSVAIIPGVAFIPGTGHAKQAVAQSAPSEQKLSQVDLVEGQLPTKPNEIALAKATAKSNKLSVGQSVTVLDKDNNPQQFTVSGVYSQGAGGGA